MDIGLFTKKNMTGKKKFKKIRQRTCISASSISVTVHSLHCLTFIECFLVNASREGFEIFLNS